MLKLVVSVLLSVQIVDVIAATHPRATKWVMCSQCEICLCAGVKSAKKGLFHMPSVFMALETFFFSMIFCAAVKWGQRLELMVWMYGHF